MPQSAYHDGQLSLSGCEIAVPRIRANSLSEWISMCATSAILPLFRKKPSPSDIYNQPRLPRTYRSIYISDHLRTACCGEGEQVQDSHRNHRVGASWIAGLSAFHKAPMEPKDLSVLEAESVGEVRHPSRGRVPWIDRDNGRQAWSRRSSQASPHFSPVAENRSAGLQTGCPEGLPALGDFATP